MNKENTSTVEVFYKHMQKQEERKKGRELAERHIAGRRKVIDLPMGQLIKVDFRNEQGV